MAQKRAKKKFGHRRTEFEWNCQHELCKAGLMQGIKSEYKGIPGRQFRFDFAWPEKMVALECEGLSYGGKNQHQSIAGYTDNCTKYNLAAVHGWTVIRITQKHMRENEWIQWLARVLGRV